MQRFALRCAVGFVLVGCGWVLVQTVTQPDQAPRSLVRVELPAGAVALVVLPAMRGRQGEVSLWYMAYDSPRIQPLFRIGGAAALPLPPVSPPMLPRAGIWSPRL